MTQYSDEVEKVRLERDADEWGKRIKYLHYNNGVEEIQLHNGDTYYKEIKEGGREWTIYAEKPVNLIDKFLRWKADYGK
jgi:hypothetical protein